MQYVKVNELPGCVRKQLKKRNYHKNDIGVETATEVCPFGAGGAGRKEYVDVINLDTGEIDNFEGSWGGANPWDPKNQVDLDRNYYSIPINGLVIKGHIGYKPWASLTVRPENAPQLLPAPGSLSEQDKLILAIIHGTIGGAYRRKELARVGACLDDLERLDRGGYLKIAKNGSIRITTTGKNACAGVRYY